MSKWIKKDDKVVVITGNDKGRIGNVLLRKGDKVVVQGINIRKKHQKRRTQSAGSEILEIERPIHISNVKLCNAEDKPVRLKAKVSADGNKEVYYLEGNKEVVHRQTKKKN